MQIEVRKTVSFDIGNTYAWVVKALNWTKRSYLKCKATKTGRQRPISRKYVFKNS